MGWMKSYDKWYAVTTMLGFGPGTIHTHCSNERNNVVTRRIRDDGKPQDVGKGPTIVSKKIHHGCGYHRGGYLEKV